MIEKIPKERPLPLYLASKIDEIITVLNTITKEKDEWPKKNDMYWYIDPLGEVRYGYWDNDLTNIGSRIRNFLGIYRSKEDATAALEKIKAKLNGVV